jgi:hypothetical protein
MQTLNDNVAVRPFVFKHDKGETNNSVKGFVGTDKLSKVIISSEVVFESKNFKPGDKVYVKGEMQNLPYVRNVFNIDGVDFILIPENLIVAKE